MPLISLRAATFDYGRERILHQVDLAVLPGVKYALVGANGAGKTTLLQVLAGEVTPQAGDVGRAGGVRIALLRQERELGADAPAGTGLRRAVLAAACARELALERELESLARAIAEAGDGRRQHELALRQGAVQAEYERLDGYGMRARLETALAGLGLPQELWERPVASLSGGERRRGALAAALLRPADLLLLDEPTNHLDLMACEWLEGHLRQHRAAAVLVSHDRRFLDEVAQRTLHLEGGRLDQYEGGWSSFARERARRRERQRTAWERQREEIRRDEDFVARNIAGQKSRQARSRRRRLEKVERLERPGAEARAPRLELSPERRSGQVVLEARGLARARGGRTLFADLELLVTRGERIGVVGPNGCGKSTLLAVLAGRLRPDAGTVTRGHNVDLGYYDQEIGGLAAGRAVLEELGAIDPLASQEALRGQLAAFGFGPDAVDRPVGRLSGGERARLALLKLVKEGHNLLLLDEPTNHLDVGCREALEEALAAYDGTLVVVSHDRRFLDEIVDRLVVFPAAAGGGPGDPPGRVEVHLGDWSDYRRRLASRAAEGNAGAPPGRGGTAPDRDRGGPAPRRAATDAADAASGLSKNEQARRRSWIEAAERRIGDLEREREDVLAAMADPGLDPQGRLELARRSQEIEAELAGRLADWERWSDELDRSAATGSGTGADPGPAGAPPEGAAR